MRKRSRLVAAAVCLASFFTISAAADEIWIAPGEKADVTLGDWGVTPTGEAHFSFALPAAMDQFVGAQVMIIGRKSKAVTYELHLSISQDGANHAAFNADVSGLPLTISTDKLSAVDASALFPTALNAGDDVVALHFKATSAPDMRVIGLRFQYTRVPDQAGLSCATHEVLVGFAAVTGAPICLDRQLLLEGLICPAGQFLIGFDTTTGALQCGGRSVLLANLTCPAGKFVTGFDGAGNLVCSSGGTGGGGSGTDLLVAINDVEVAEGDSGTTPMVFQVTLSSASAMTVTVPWATRAVTPGPGVADPGTDFVAASGTVTFAPGDLSQPVTIQIVGDATVEDSEEFFVDLGTPTSGDATVGDGEGRGRIFDNDNDGRDE